MLLLNNVPAPSPVRCPELNGRWFDLTSFVPGTNEAALSNVCRVVVVAPHAHEPKIGIRFANPELVRNNCALPACINDVTTMDASFFTDAPVFISQSFAAIIEINLLYADLLKNLHAMALGHAQENFVELIAFDVQRRPAEAEIGEGRLANDPAPVGRSTRFLNKGSFFDLFGCSGRIHVLPDMRKNTLAHSKARVADLFEQDDFVSFLRKEICRSTAGGAAADDHDIGLGWNGCHAGARSTWQHCSRLLYRRGKSTAKLC